MLRNIFFIPEKVRTELLRPSEDVMTRNKRLKEFDPNHATQTASSSELRSEIGELRAQLAARRQSISTLRHQKEKISSAADQVSCLASQAKLALQSLEDQEAKPISFRLQGLQANHQRLLDLIQDGERILERVEQEKANVNITEMGEEDPMILEFEEQQKEIETSAESMGALRRMMR